MPERAWRNRWAQHMLDTESRKCGRMLCHCFLDAFLMGAGSEELSVPEMSIETATGQREHKE